MKHISKDALWKGIIEGLFEDFCAYFFPTWAAQVADLSKPVEFLDKELEAIFPESANQKRYADKLVKVFTKEGKEQWILVHIEVQGYEDTTFAERMFTYFYRILDRYQHQVMALAILTDSNGKYHPQQYLYQYENTKCSYEFDSLKVLQKSEQELQIANNPFSVVMLAAKKALYKKNLMDSQQLVWKKSLVEALRDANYSDEKIRRLLYFIRYYVKFNNEESLQTLEENIQTTFKHRKNMGIEEVILEATKEEGRQEGKEEGRVDEKKQTALRMKKAGVSIKDIAKYTGLTQAQIKKLT